MKLPSLCIRANVSHSGRDAQARSRFFLAFLWSPGVIQLSPSLTSKRRQVGRSHNAKSGGTPFRSQLFNGRMTFELIEPLLH